MPPDVDIRAIADLDGCQAVVDVQFEVWGEVFETVPASVLLVSVKRGGILLGAFTRGALVGFVWSMPGWRDGRPTQWSHMLGVLEAARGMGIGVALKRAQRDRAVAAGMHLIEWTFDPLQARNAHLNIARLGCLASVYLPNAYGALDGPLHRGAPTDRLIAEWWLTPSGAGEAGDGGAPPRSLTTAVPSLVATRRAGAWCEVVDIRPAAGASCVSIPVPARFGAMLGEAVGLAEEWRLATRQAFLASFAVGYQVVGFDLHRETGGGRYLLATDQGRMRERCPS